MMSHLQTAQITMIRLGKARHQKILYNQLVSSLGSQIPDRWERMMFRDMVGNTIIKPVDKLSSSGGWKLEGQNVHRVVIGPGGAKAIGPVEVYVPKETLAKLKGLQSGNRVEREAAEEALHTTAHELAHDYFKAVNYEARMTRYLADNPRVAQNYLQRFLERTGKFRQSESKEKAQKLVRDNPLYWSNYVAHTAHEAGADIMATEAVTRVAEGRAATPRDLERFTALRPFTVREFERIAAGRSIGAKRPRKPSRLEELARGVEYSSMKFMNQVGTADRVLRPKWEFAPHTERRRAV